MSRLGALPALLVASLALAGCGAAAASSPPHLAKKLPVIQLPAAQHGTVSCNAHARQAKSKAARVARKLSPVACEQPPRSQVRDVGQLILGP
jgi:hypothetical protein